MGSSLGQSTSGMELKNDSCGLAMSSDTRNDATSDRSVALSSRKIFASSIALLRL